MRALRRAYGAGPLHLLAHAAAIAVAAFALSRILDPRYAHPVNFAAWFLGGALVHDLVLLPLYSIAGLLAGVVVADDHRLPVRLVNHLRVPAVVSGILLLVFLPLVLGDGRANYVRDSGHAPPDRLARWALITAGLFAGSGVLLILRRARSRRRRRSAP